MPAEAFVSLLLLAFAGAWTPGPNNAMVASSGAVFGLRRTIPHVLGIAFGFPLMTFVVGMFLGEVFAQSAALREGLRYGGAALLLWMAWKTANAGGPGSVAPEARPLSFLQAAAFQWINPKAWVMAVAITSTFIADTAPLRAATIIAAVFLAAGLTSAFGWAWAGQAMARWLGDGPRLRAFNIAMALIIAAGAVAVLAD